MRHEGTTAVVLDQHPLWLYGVSSILKEMEIDVVGTATTPEAAVALTREHHPDLFIFDPAVVDTDGSWVRYVEDVRASTPTARLIVLSAGVDDETVAAAMQCGVVVYGSKASDSEDIKTAIRQAFNCTIFHAFVSSPTTASDSERHLAAGGATPLTRREEEVLRLAAEGLTNAQMAQRLWVTEETIKFHLSNTYRKIGVNNRTQASHWAVEQGLVPAGVRPAIHMVPPLEERTGRREVAVG
jgi:DNA-binding NarL/FixJ family response regulator